MDERQRGAVGTASTAAMVVTFIYLLVESTYKFVTTGDILSCSWEIGLILLGSVVFIIAMRSKNEMGLPQTFLGKPLPAELTNEARKTRVKTYIVSSVVFAVAMTVVYVITAFLKLNDGFSMFSTSAHVVKFVVLFLASFTIKYFVFEFQVKRYNEYLKELEQ